MLSYRHGFHAGNFADVLKHLVLQRILVHLGKKTAPFCCIDTHAGSGGYALTHAYALKNKEFENGIGKLWRRQDLPDSIAEYVNLIRKFNRDLKLSYYPGSPLIMQRYLRGKDRMFLYELHNTEIKLLSSAIKPDKHILIAHADGFQAGLKALPPIERRGLVFIDPAYELKSDYAQVVTSLKNMHQRFATGTYALWYPVIERDRNHSLERAIANCGIKNIQLFELGITEDGNHQGMSASGVIVVNPPWTLSAEMRIALPWLAEVLGVAGAGHFRAEQLVAE